MTNRKAFKLLGLTLVVLMLLSAPISAAPSPSAQGSAPFVEGEILFQVKPGVSPSEMARTVGGSILRRIGSGDIYLLKVRDGAVPTAVQALQGRQGVAFAEPNWLRELHGPNDPGYDLKWDLNNAGTLCDDSGCAVTDADMDWEEAYNYLGSNLSGSSVVAVVDTGIDGGHPDLDGKIINGYDFLDGDTIPKDTYGHGTHVAGIALAETNNGTGTSGVGYSPNIKVMPLRVCDQNGCPSDAVANAIYWAADHGANVINLSLGGRFGSTAEQIAIDYAWGQGLVIAASSGNDGARRVSYPAAFTNCIAVGSTTWDDTLANYSNKGSELDVSAPGGEMSVLHDKEGIYSTMPTYPVYLTTEYGYSEDYDQLQGTSMAAPQVAGLAGLLFAVGVEDTNGDGKFNDEIRGIIEGTVDDLGAAGWDTSFGWGRINVFNAVQAAGGGGEPTPTPTPTTEPTATPTPEPTATPEPGGTMHVSDIDMWYTVVNKNKGSVDTQVTIVDDAGNPVLDAVVYLEMALPGGGTASGSGQTGADGTVTFSLSIRSSETGTYESTVTNVTHATLTYDSGANVETSETYTH
jgi:hypothetical protein